MEQDQANTGHISLQKFIALLKGLSEGLLTDHECLTLGRAFGQRAYPILPSLVKVVQDDLHKHNYTQFTALEAAFAECCQDGTAFVEPAQLRQICQTTDLPLSHQLVDATLMNCQTSSSGAVDYQQFLQLINWKDHPLPTHPNTVRSHPTIYLSLQRYGHMHSLSVQQACQDHGQVVGASLRAYLVWTILPSCLHCRHTISHFTTQHAAGYTCTYRTADNIGHAFHLQN